MEGLERSLPVCCPACAEKRPVQGEGRFHPIPKQQTYSRGNSDTEAIGPVLGRSFFAAGLAPLTIARAGSGADP